MSEPSHDGCASRLPKDFHSAGRLHEDMLPVVVKQILHLYWACADVHHSVAAVDEVALHCDKDVGRLSGAHPESRRLHGAGFLDKRFGLYGANLESSSD